MAARSVVALGQFLVLRQGNAGLRHLVENVVVGKTCLLCLSW